MNRQYDYSETTNDRVKLHLQLNLWFCTVVKKLLSDVMSWTNNPTFYFAFTHFILFSVKYHVTCSIVVICLVLVKIRCQKVSLSFIFAFADIIAKFQILTYILSNLIHLTIYWRKWKNDALLVTFVRYWSKTFCQFVRYNSETCPGIIWNCVFMPWF